MRGISLAGLMIERGHVSSLPDLLQHGFKYRDGLRFGRECFARPFVCRRSRRGISAAGWQSRINCAGARIFLTASFRLGAAFEEQTVRHVILIDVAYVGHRFLADLFSAMIPRYETKHSDPNLAPAP